MLLKKVTTFKNKLTGKAKVNYLSGLWLNCQFRNQSDLVIDIEINGVSILTGQTSQDIQDDYVVYDLHLPVVKMAEALDKNETLDIIVTDNNGKQLINTSVSDEVVYLKEFEYIAGDINTTLSHLPLINKTSVKYLSEDKKLAIINNIFEANLEKDALDKLNLLIHNLNDYMSVINSDEISWLQYNKEFLSLLLNTYRPVISNPYYSFIKKALSSLMYLDAKSIIEYAQLEDADKQHLLNECVVEDENKFNFVEYFPADDESGLVEWQALSDEQQSEYWPLLTCGFEYRREFNRITSYEPKYHWFTDKPSDDRNAQVKSIIQNGDTKWFGMSVIVFEYESGTSTAELTTHLQEFVWANWNESYVNIDSFCYVLIGLLNRGLSNDEYKDLTGILVELLKSRMHKCENDIYRQCLIECVTHYINHGIKTADWEFGALAEVVRPYYAFDDYFLDHVNYAQIQYFDHQYHEFATQVYDTAKSIKVYIDELAYDSPPSVVSLRETFAKLAYLNDNHIYFVDKWILALSRYCQLHNIESLYPELAIIHESIEDYFGALNLVSSASEKQRLERLITQSGKDAKRKDSYWFERSLTERVEPVSLSRVEYIAELHQFLSNTKDGQHYSNEDLVHLLASEIAHFLMQGGKYSQVEAYLPLLNQAYVAGHSAILTTNWIVNGERNLTELNQLAKNCGEYGELKWLIEDLGQSLDDILNEKAQNELLTSIKQHYVYPYLQVMIYSCNAYENTRHQIIRDSWLPKLKQLDIDYCIVVGDAEESHMDGDKMRLAVLDTYEELPHKSVEMFRFAHRNSHHRYYYKLDDDCVLNINAMFGDPAFLEQAYFGRVVKRPLGGVDRSWHHQKSRTQEAKTALDLSPEFSEYCDGSTGYILNRWAAEQLTYQAESNSNEQLVTNSYFEDKLVGDLLARSDIYGQSNGYNTLVKRTLAPGIDTQIWEYGLHANRKNNVKVVHTESDKFRLEFGKSLNIDKESEALLFRDATATMQPEFYSDSECEPVIEKLFVDEEKIRSSKHIAIIVGKNEQELLPNLLKHHRSIGIEHFLFVDNCSTDNSIEYMKKQEDVSVFIATQEYRHSRFAVNWQETLLSHYGLGRWALIIDSDELFTYSGSESKQIGYMTNLAERQRSNSFYAPMIDFYPYGGLDSAQITGDKQFYEVCDYYDPVDSMKTQKNESYGPYSNSSIIYAGLRERIFGGYNQFPAPNYLNQKYNLLKYVPNMRLVEGLHFMYGQRVCLEKTAIMHFKYHAGFYSKVIREINSGQHWNGATEYKRYAKSLEANKESIMFEESLSQKYLGSHSLFSRKVI